jgi:hypothetical protein
VWSSQGQDTVNSMSVFARHLAAAEGCNPGKR